MRVGRDLTYPFQYTRWISKLFGYGYFQHRKVINHNLKVYCLMTCAAGQSAIKLHVAMFYVVIALLKKLT